MKENGVTPADPFDVGSGLLALGGAANVGLVFDETGANYAAANPGIGGDPKTLHMDPHGHGCGGWLLEYVGQRSRRRNHRGHTEHLLAQRR